jgi:hypothetical protein
VVSIDVPLDEYNLTGHPEAEKDFNFIMFLYLSSIAECGIIALPMPHFVVDTKIFALIV